MKRGIIFGVCIVVIVLIGITLYITEGWKNVIYKVRVAIPGLPIPPEGIWAGTWNRVGHRRFSPASVEISNVTATSFEFDLTAYCGVNVGEITGTAKIINQNHAVYEDKEVKCQVTFTLKENTLTIETTERCSYYAGLGVEFDGDYRKGTQKEESTLKELRVLENESQEQEFSKLVGKDYALFLGSFHLVYEEEDLDNFGAKVLAGNVRGLGGILCAIIMISPKGRIWAAVTDVELDVVKYFTNDPKYAKKLPKTIDRWRERLPYKKVIFAAEKAQLKPK